MSQFENRLEIVIVMLLYLLAGLLALCYYWVKKRYSFWTDRGFISPPSSFPFGSLKGVGRKHNAAEGIDIVYKQFKGKTTAVGAFIFFKPTIIPIDPELFKNILVRDFTSFHDRGFFHNKVDQPISAK